jgi:DNA-binding NarL/FixJ family response regulator
VTKESIRVLVVEDHHVVRQGLVALLNVVEGSGSGGPGRGRRGGDHAVPQAPAGHYAHGPAPAAHGRRGRDPAAAHGDAGARFIVLTTYDGDEDIYRALQAGARAYLLKGMTSEELIATIRAVHAGKSHIPPAIAEKLAERMGTEELTPREFDVLEQIVHGKSNKEIATELEISEATVKTHINSCWASWA